jgi:PAS domain S-box-containing protein
MAEGVALHEIIYDQSGEAVDYVVTDVNPSYEQILGVKGDEAVGSRGSDLYGAGEAPYLDAYARTADTGAPTHFETYFPPMDKHFNISAVSPGKGKFATIFFDVSEQKRAEEALRESEERYRTLSDATFEGIGVIQEGVVIDANQQFADVFGYDGDEILGMGIGQLIHLVHPEDMDRVWERIRAGKEEPYELCAVRKDGTLVSVEVRPRMMLIEGRPTRISAIRDVTERKRVEEELKRHRAHLEEIVDERTAELSAANQQLTKQFAEREQAEEALRQSEEMFRNIVESSPLGMHMYRLEPNGRLVFVGTNPAADKILGVTNSQFVGRTIEEAFPALAETEVPDRYRRAAAEGVPWHTDQIMYEENEISGAFQVDAFQTSPGRMVAMFLDITKPKQAEQKLRRSSEQLRELSARLESVAEAERAAIAREIHDELGQVLTALKMELSWLGKRLTEEQQPLVERTKSMSELVDGAVKQVQRICSQLRPRLLDDLGLTAAIEWQAQDFERRTGIRCEVAPEPGDVVTDKERATAVFRVFQEALTNVARHAAASRVTVDLTRTNERIELKVKDNGKGITREQISSPRSLGLTGMDERARSLGGEVSITGNRDRGTTIALTIPAQGKEESDD